MLHRVRNLREALLDNPFSPARAAFYRYAPLRLHLGAHRYAHMLKHLALSAPRRILEVGTNTGVNAERMIRAARVLHPDAPVHYVGFDLFEDFSSLTMEQEFSMVPASEAAVRRHLQATGAEVTLFRGDSRATLPAAVPTLCSSSLDFVFIDGGHSVETTRSDWRNLQPLVGSETVVYFDDYYANPVEKLKQFGCNEVVDAIDRTEFEVRVLAPGDRFQKDFGVLEIHFCEVRRRAPAAG